MKIEKNKSLIILSYITILIICSLLVLFNYLVSGVLFFLGYHLGVSNYLYLKAISLSTNKFKVISFHFLKIINFILIFLSIILFSIDSKNLVISFSLNATGFTISLVFIILYSLRKNYALRTT